MGSRQSSTMRISHKDLLESALLQYSNGDPDITVICDDGKQIHTTKFLLGIYSPWLQKIFLSVDSHLSLSIFLPVASTSVICMLKILATGLAISDDNSDLADINDITDLLSIPFAGWELGSRVVSPRSSLKRSKSLKKNDKVTEGNVVKKIKLDDHINKKIKKENLTFDDLDSVFSEFSDVVDDTQEDEKKNVASINKVDTTVSEEVDKEGENSKDGDKKRLSSQYYKRYYEKRKRENRPMCSKCGEKFVNKSCLEKHLEMNVCGRKAAKKDKLRRMMDAAIAKVNS